MRNSAKQKGTVQSKAFSHPCSLELSAAAGKALRGTIPLTEHGIWKASGRRVDPIGILRASDADRVPELVPIKYGRMLQSPLAFYRGAAGVMASDLANTPTTALKVQACGDCHLMNFGGFATPERNVIFDLNDFDETLPAPWEWDIKRLAASFVLAGRSNGLGDQDGRNAAIACAQNYRKHLREFSQMHPLEVWYARLTFKDFMLTLPPAPQALIQQRIEKAMERSGSEMDLPKLTGMVDGEIRIRDIPPLIYHPEQARAPEFKTILDQLFAAYRETLPEDRRVLLARYRVVDAANKVVGVGSVGRRCWIVLLTSASKHVLFLQVKEAVKSVLEPYAGESTHLHHGQRVVTGQRLMQPASDLFLGWLTAPNGEQFYVRQLRDAKIKPLHETFDAEMLNLYAKACGWALARAHAKASDVAVISGYLGKSGQFDEAVGDFALVYADQAERDHAALKAEVKAGKIVAHQESSL